MTLITDSEQLRLFFPNSIEPVEPESTLYDKLAGFLQAAEDWAASALMPQSTLEAVAARPLTDLLRRHASSLVIAEALAQALPSLDVVLTPNGFGVVATANVAAASKQRVDRLIASLREQRDNALEETLLLLPDAYGWAASPQASYFGATLFPNIDLASLCGFGTGRWEKYKELRERVIGIEQALAEDYFSAELMQALREQLLFGTLTADRLRVVQALRSQIVDVLKDRPINATRMRDIVNHIRYNESAYPEWHSSATAKLFAPPKFENKKESKGYWF